MNDESAKKDNINENMVVLVHFTSPTAYESIQSIGALLLQSERQARGLTFHFEGSANRRVGPNDITREELMVYHEGIGVYFRILPTVPVRRKNVVAIVFSPTMLTKYDGWFINTEENHGFKLGEMVIKSPSSGEYGKTVYDVNCAAITDRSELIIPHSVSLVDAIKIVSPAA